MIRRMCAQEIARVAELERSCFSCPWSLKLLEEGLLSPLDVYYVVEEEGLLCGYCDLRVIAGEGEIERIAVHPDCRGRGFAKQMMEQMVSFAKEQGVSEITLEVRTGNLAAIRLYESYGFREEAVRKGYYREPLEDGIIMWLRGI
ncbi:MAG: ribosomal protein S18-alanine N-acetyltransferase [Hungatella sp.]